MSSSTSAAYEDTFEHLEGFSQVEQNDGFDDEDDGDDDDYDFTLPASKADAAPRPPSAVTSDSSGTLALSSSSKISKPSGLPIDTIARLTHDELQHNPEFMKHVNLVASLQELLRLREKSATHRHIRESPPFAFAPPVYAHLFGRQASEYILVSVPEPVSLTDYIFVVQRHGVLAFSSPHQSPLQISARDPLDLGRLQDRPQRRCLQ